MLVIMSVPFITFWAGDLDAWRAASVTATLTWRATDEAGLGILGISLLAVKPDQHVRANP